MYWVKRFLCLCVLFLGLMWLFSPSPFHSHALTPADDFDVLAAQVGRSEAWYWQTGYLTAPPPAAKVAPTFPVFPVGSEGVTITLTPTLYLPAVTHLFALPQVERRAIWITRYDWTSLVTAPEAQKIDEMVDQVAAAGFNTIFFQVRAAGDAYYTPGLEPWAARLSTGTPSETLGVDPGWDPLARMLDLAHARGLEVHAYLNVYPAWLSAPDSSYGQLWPPATTPPQMFDRFTYGPTHTDHPGELSLGWTWRQYDAEFVPMPLSWNSYVWASPGVDAVQEHVVNVACDVVTRYAVDGVHLDLLRYAGPDYSYDPQSVAATDSLTSTARAQWQRERVTALVARVYTETRALDEDIWLSAAVWPYYLDSWGWGVTEGYSDYFQDSKGWLAAGVLDAIAPMLYGSVADELGSWSILAEDFLAASAGRHVYPGIGGYYPDFERIAERIAVARELGAPGHVLFSYGALDQQGYWDDLAAGPYRLRADLPVRP